MMYILSCKISRSLPWDLANTFEKKIQSSRATSRVSCGQKPNVSETISASIISIPLMMEAEMVSETLGFCPQLTQLVAREDFIEFIRCESLKSYTFEKGTLCTCPRVFPT
jgi:hypothetical protein